MSCHLVVEVIDNDKYSIHTSCTHISIYVSHGSMHTSPSIGKLTENRLATCQQLLASIDYVIVATGLTSLAIVAYMHGQWFFICDVTMRPVGEWVDIESCGRCNGWARYLWAVAAAVVFTHGSNYSCLLVLVAVLLADSLVLSACFWFLANRDRWYRRGRERVGGWVGALLLR